MDRIPGGLALVAGLTMALAACTSAAAPTGPGPAAGGSPSGAIQPPATSAGGATGDEGEYEGTLVSSGLYEATWTVAADMDPTPFNSYGAATLTSDRGTFGNVSVQLDGTVSFGSGAPELADHGLAYTGGGAAVIKDATGAFVCSFTLDADLEAEGGAVLHVAGTMTVHWHPEGIGDLSCP